MKCKDVMMSRKTKIVYQSFAKNSSSESKKREENEWLKNKVNVKEKRERKN